jgi:4-carboxymuconolactone decarboxylase
MLSRFVKFCLILIYSGAVADDGSVQLGSLSARQQCVVTISAYTAKGDLPVLLLALREGLTAGLTVNEIKEELIHLSAYCGFPRSLNAINTFDALLTERRSKGISDVEGQRPLKVADSGKYAEGKKVLETLTGKRETGPKTGYAAFVPAIDTLLKEHLFNDLFTRGILDHKQRELITVSALVAMGGVASQLSGHIGICLNLGFTGAELRQVISLIEAKVGKKEADEGRLVLEKILATRN